MTPLQAECARTYEALVNAIMQHCRIPGLVAKLSDAHTRACAQLAVAEAQTEKRRAA